jgi:hypothetical protein
MDYLSYAPVLIELGNEAGYEKLRDSAITKMGDSVELVVAERVLLACLLLPPKDKHMPTLDKWAQVSITLNQGCWACAALALLEYRRKEYDEALEWCRKSLNTGLEPRLRGQQAATLKREGSSTPLTCAVRARVIQAMSYARLKQLDRAHADIVPCRELIESKFKGELGMGTYESGFWKDWLIDRILLREAIALIENNEQAAQLPRKPNQRILNEAESNPFTPASVTNN